MGNKRSGKKKRQNKNRQPNAPRTENTDIVETPAPVSVSQIETSEETESASIHEENSTPISRRETPEISDNLADATVSAPKVSIQPEEEAFDEGVVASSTPVPEAPSAVPENPVSEHVDVESSPVGRDLTEETPLLPETDLENWAGVESNISGYRQRWQSRLYCFFRSRSLWRGVIFVFMIVLLGLVLGFSIDFQKLGNEAFTPEIQRISVLGIHPKGVSFQVAGTIETNYDNVGNYVLRHLARYTALLIGGVYIAPKNECSVYITTESVSGVRLFDMFPPGLAVDLIDHRVSEFEFISDANFAAKGAAGLFETILSHGFGNPQTLELEIRLAPKISGRWFGFQLNPASVFHTIQFPPQNFKFPLEVQDPSVTTSGNLTEVGFSLQAAPLPAKVSLEAIEWNIAIPDCDMHPVNLGDWRTSAFSIDPDVLTQIGFSGVFEKIPLELTKECSDGITPINRFVRSAVNDKTLHAYVSGKPSEANSKKVPEWLYQIITSATANVVLPLPSFQGETAPVLPTDFLVESSSVTVNSDKNGVLSMVVDTTSRFGLELSVKLSNFDVLASNVTSTIFLKENSSTFIEASVARHGELQLDSTCDFSGTLALDCKNVLVNIAEPQTAGRFLNALLTGHTVEVPEWLIHLNEASIESPIASTLLKDLTFESKALAVPGIMGFSERNESFFNWLLEKAQVSTDRIYLTYSDQNRVEFLVDFQVTNPLNVSLKIADENMLFDLKYNQTAVGSVSFHNLKVPKTNERVLLTATLTLFYDSSAQRIVSEDFLSHVISGAENIYFGVSGSRAKSAESETGLSKFLEQIQIQNLRLPEVNFTKSDASKDLLHAPILQSIPILDDIMGRKEEQPKRQSPFLVSATFHLLSAEIELTVFNPIANVELRVQIIKCLASHEGEALAHIEWSELLMIPPGISTTPRIPIKIAKGIGADTLRKYINGDLAVDVLAELSVRVDKFPTELMYRGGNLTANVKL